MDGAEERIQYKNITKTEAGVAPSGPSKLGLFTVNGAVIVLVNVVCEIGKHVSNYSINYFNNGTYPLPQTILVVLRSSSSLEQFSVCDVKLCLLINPVLKHPLSFFFPL